jgi:hypothetical protein
MLRASEGRRGPGAALGSGDKRPQPPGQAQSRVKAQAAARDGEYVRNSHEHPVQGDGVLRSGTPHAEVLSVRNWMTASSISEESMPPLPGPRWSPC